ncbi:AEC family transporter [Streptomyces sp. SL13]|uniref:AEC family transporter n=1 Tax=Streptantibioticus silvisoli TaxID=2705255 RepID=A0AA90H5G3_9ACTN|nr:AEC family transporter [Streptantibioticus silvisoli]MDI5962099.1 AEC family transporter [Streptantibioticus silvisoli]MDI5971318.1 AEC family transporter [Streptantibioticus silvisoli]
MLPGFLPIWAIAALGWFAGRFNVLGADAQPVLGRFAFSFGMPALIFMTLAGSRFSEVANPGVLAFCCSLVVVFAVGLALSRWVFGRRQAEQSISAMAAAYVNSANLGIPVALHVLHDTSFVVTAALFQQLIVTPTILVLIDLDAGAGSGPPWGRLLRLPFRNPIIAASAAGAAVSALGWHVPDLVGSPLRTLGDAGVPAALMALGMSLHGRLWPPPGTRTERFTLVALKVAAQPLVAYALARWAFGLHGHLLFAVVLCAGLPTAQNAFIFATEYDLDTDLPRDAVLLSTLLSMLSLSVITWLLA